MAHHVIDVTLEPGKYTTPGDATGSVRADRGMRVRYLVTPLRADLQSSDEETPKPHSFGVSSSLSGTMWSHAQVHPDAVPYP